MMRPKELRVHRVPSGSGKGASLVLPCSFRNNDRSAADWDKGALQLRDQHRPWSRRSPSQRQHPANGSAKA